jgi:hypothetical protein
LGFSAVRVDKIESDTLVFWEYTELAFQSIAFQTFIIVSALISGGLSMNATRRAVRRKQVLRKFWRAFIADAGPDEKERIRRERINNIMHNVVLLEAMRRWEIESGRQ